MFYLLIFILGLLVGSFLNSVIYRLQTGESILFTRSHCPKCGEILKWFDLIPVFSFIFQPGRCRYCGQKISWQYPAVEIATGLLFLLILNSQFSMLQVYYIIITCFLIVIFVYDFKHYIIPDKVIYPALLLATGYWLLVPGFSYSTLLSALGAGGFFLSLVLISRGKWMGLGDVKLAVLMGLVLGWPNILLALFLAFISGALIGLFLILAKKKTWQSQIPFGPFLSAATLATLLFGDYLIKMIEVLIL